jgi:hypothetical protein
VAIIIALADTEGNAMTAKKGGGLYFLVSKSYVIAGTVSLPTTTQDSNQIAEYVRSVFHLSLEKLRTANKLLRIGSKR